jgi:uncharacterized repeat protein (TIGR03803 family)
MKRIITFIFLSLLLTIMANAQTHLWGTTSVDGGDNNGTIFMTDINGNNLHSVYSLIGTTGSFPYGGLTLASNNKFYGVTLYGGCNNGGVCYCYDPITGIFTDIHDFACHKVDGCVPKCGPIAASDGKLYGTCSSDSINHSGVIYSIDPATNIYTVVFNFTDSLGGESWGSLIQLSDGKLYGTNGSIFSFDPATHTYNRLYTFDSLTGNSLWYSGLLHANDGKLYGATTWGGTYNAGVIFSFDVATNTYTDLHDFNDTLGQLPYGGLIQASNGLLYGMTNEGGSLAHGLLFSYDISTNTFTDLVNFIGNNGQLPSRDLMQASNGLIFGTTYWGGTYGYGVFFSFNPVTNIQTVLYNFESGINGTSPECSLIEVPDSLTQGINTITNREDIKVYPNPATSTITIRNFGLGMKSELEITDVLDNTTYHQTLNNINKNIDVSGFSNGIYFYQLTNNKETYRGKFVVEK